MTAFVLLLPALHWVCWCPVKIKSANVNFRCIPDILWLTAQLGWFPAIIALNWFFCYLSIIRLSKKKSIIRLFERKLSNFGPLGHALGSMLTLSCGPLTDSRPENRNCATPVISSTASLGFPFLSSKSPADSSLKWRVCVHRWPGSPSRMDPVLESDFVSLILFFVAWSIWFLTSWCDWVCCSQLLFAVLV